MSYQETNYIEFVLDNQIIRIDFNENKYKPTTTVLHYLRSISTHKGVKEGCGEGDCGACTVVIAQHKQAKLEYVSYNSCLVFLPFLHGKQLITVENLANGSKLHPVQQALVELAGSQCGYCTPGIVMSMFALYKNENEPTKEKIVESMSGNLCRCTGYRPIIDAALKSCNQNGIDQFSEKKTDTIQLLNQINSNSTSVRIKKAEYQYYLPETIDEALSCFAQFPELRIINGATDIALEITKKKKKIDNILDLSNIQALNFIYSEDGVTKIGASTSIETIMNYFRTASHPLGEMLTYFGSKQIRNKASLAGNIASASPIGDTIPVLMALKASITLRNQENQRTLSISDFITGYRQTALKKGEIIIEIQIPELSQDYILKSYKISKRRQLDISTVTACFSAKIEDNKVSEFYASYGGMAATPKEAKFLSKALKGKVWNRESVELALSELEKDFSPISDARSEKDSRMFFAKNLVLKFFSETNDI